MHNTALCEQCRDLVVFETAEQKITTEIKGIKFTYLATVAKCPNSNCHEELYVAELHDANIDKMKAAYTLARTETVKKLIDEITEKYNIGKKPLAKVLGWSETTIIRYYNVEQYPVKEYLSMLNSIKDDSRKYHNILEKGKNQLTDVAYRKSKVAVKELRIELPKSEKKIDSVIRYLLLKCEDVTPLSLQKLLYYSQSFNKVFNGKFLFKDDCEAWVHGPVYRETYYKYREYGHNVIDTVKLEKDNFSLSTEERELLDCVVKYFGCYSGKTLEQMTHSERPWSTTRKNLKPDEYSYDKISKDLIETYFREVKEKYNLINPNDLKSYSMDLFKKTPC